MYRLIFVTVGMFCWLLFVSAKPAGENRDVERKLALAFGGNKYVTNSIVKFEMKRHGWVIACDKVEFQAEGKVKLTPAYIARFNSPKNPDQGIKEAAPHAYLEFDQKVKSIADMSQATIKRMEFRDGCTAGSFGYKAH